MICPFRINQNSFCLSDIDIVFTLFNPNKRPICGKQKCHIRLRPFSHGVWPAKTSEQQSSDFRGNDLLSPFSSFRFLSFSPVSSRKEKPSRTQKTNRTNLWECGRKFGKTTIFPSYTFSVKYFLFLFWNPLLWSPERNWIEPWITAVIHFIYSFFSWKEVFLLQLCTSSSPPPFSFLLPLILPVLQCDLFSI